MAQKTDEQRENGQRPRRWYQKYLPFIARTPEMQVEWLITECQRGKLTREDLMPYVRLLFCEENMDNQEELQALLAGLTPEMCEQLLRIADIYDVPKVVKLLPELNVTLVEIALSKELPPYETKPQQVMDKVLYAINDRSEELLLGVAGRLLESGDAPDHFRENYGRFRAILEDEEFIRTLWPQAQ